MLVESHAAWSGTPTAFAYQWLRCDGYGHACAPIAAATSQTYTLTAADVKHTVRVSEMASDASSTSGPAISAPTAIVLSPSLQGQPPANAGLPLIFGTPYIGGPLQASTGAWASLSRVSYAYQWQRCRRGCVNIAGATRPQYTPVASDGGAPIRVLVTAGNATGRATAASARTGPVGISDAVIQKPLATALLPAGRSARIRAIRASGGYPAVFAAPLPGRLMLVWYYLPKGAHLARVSVHSKPKPEPVPVAVGGAVVTRRGKVKVKIRMTTQGTKQLQGIARIKLTGVGTFTPSGRPGVRVVATFSLAR